MGSSYYNELSFAAAKEYIKEIEQSFFCECHKKRARLFCDYDSDGINAYIIKCCCLDYAHIIAHALYEGALCRNVYLEVKTGLVEKVTLIDAEF